MVIGETGIVSQVKSAYEMAHKNLPTGRNLNKLFQRAFSVNKDLRTRTLLQQGRSSVASVAASLVHQTCGRLEPLHALVIGAGQTAEDVARGLQRHGCSQLTIVNRSEERAVALALKVGATAAQLSQWPALASAADIIVAATGSPVYLVTADVLASALTDRVSRPMLLLDLNVPANIEPACSRLPEVTLRGLNDVQTVIEVSMRQRRDQLVICEVLLEEHVRDFLESLVPGPRSLVARQGPRS